MKKIEKELKRKQKEEKFKLKENEGITLIALVITIIVLLILAGISIAMLTGENGILSQATKAKEETEKAQVNEALNLEEYNKFLNNAIGETTREEPEGPPKDDQGFFEENSTINGEKGTAMNPIIPGGFKPVDTDTSTWGDGSSAPTEENVNNGLVIQDKVGNEFVWIPVKSEAEYARDRSYESTSISAGAYTDIGYLPDEMETGNSAKNESVEKNAVVSKGGFYISRFEAGREYDGKEILVSKKSAEGMTTSNAGSNENLKNITKEFSGDNENIKSALCSGIQWDITMKFVNGKLDGTGETFNVKEFNRNRHSDIIEASTGENEADKVCNIYDLEGNCVEYVAEKTNYNNEEECVVRGGVRYVSNPQTASGRSTQDDMGLSNVDCTCRFVLYVM